MAEEKVEEEKVEEEKPVKKRKPEVLEKIPVTKIRGRVVIINPEESEFAKNLGLTKKGDYQKKK
ncbi:MAG: hypothetical protein U9Q06_01120 [Nanoarchaeota archaeon]|nr:hypothetical protein [Nanoarchaeota archaeon]